MSCPECHTKDEMIRELETKVRRLESMKEPMFPVNIPIPNPPHPDLDIYVEWAKEGY